MHCLPLSSIENFKVDICSCFSLTSECYISWNHFLKVRQSYYYIAFLTYTVAVCLKIFTAFPKFQGFLIGPKDFLIRFYPITPLYLNGQSALKELSENPYKAMTIYFQSHKRQFKKCTVSINFCKNKTGTFTSNIAEKKQIM